MSKAVVITGSTRGIGFGMAAAFLRAGHNVVVSGRKTAAVDQAVAALQALGHPGHVLGIACDVTDRMAVETLWSSAVARFGRVDIWINNAGLINRYRPIGDLPEDDITNVIAANVSGTLYGSNTAVREMSKQTVIEGWRGAIYNFEGFGSDGMKRAGMSVYGATKQTITYFTKALIKEMKGREILVGYIQPGIVITDLGLGEAAGQPAATLRKEKKFIMMFGDPVAPVADFIVDRILHAPRHGARINWLSVPKLLWRVATARLLGRDPFTAAGMT